MPRATMFAECILSGTQQTGSLPSAVKKMLGKIIALGKRGKKTLESLALGKQEKKTLGKS